MPWSFIACVVQVKVSLDFFEENPNKARFAGGSVSNTTVAVGQTFFVPKGQLITVDDVPNLFVQQMHWQELPSPV